MARAALHLVTWNGERYMSFLFASLRAQTLKNCVLRILDNGSTDKTLECINYEIARGMPWPVEIVKNESNVGFAGGHNQLFELVKEDFLFLLNQDMYVMPECLETMLGIMLARPACGAVGARLMRWDFGRIASEGLVASFSDRIDSLGHERLRSRRFIERRSGELYKGGESVLPVVGISGALPLYRVAAVHAVAVEGRYLFDPFFESYKEDVDLSWRLAERGYEIYVAAEAVAYHDRTAAMPLGGLSDGAAWRNKRMQSERVRFLSYRNHLKLLVNHETWKTFLPDTPWILWYEAKKMIALLFSSPRLVARAWRDVIASLARRDADLRSAQKKKSP